MSGREHEPIAAFFPSIDRNLIRDLDRHLRNAAPLETKPALPAEEATKPQEIAAQRPRTAEILEAVEQAASSMTAMTQRIQELEAKQYELEGTNNQLRTKLGEVLQLQQASESKARTEGERADRAEELAAHHLARSQGLENDLATALGDLRKIADAITGTLGAASA